MKRLLLFASLIVMSSCFASSSSGMQNTGDAEWFVRWQDHRLSVQATNIDLPQVISAVAEQTGMEITGMDKLTGKVQANFSKLPLNEGLAVLLQQANYSLQESGEPGQAPYVLSVISYPSPATGASRKTESAHPFKIPASVGYVPEPYRKLYALAAQGDVKSLREAATAGDTAALAIAIKLLARKDPAEAISLVAETARSDDPAKRLSAVQSLGELDGKGVLTTLGAALADPDMSIRQSAVLGLHNQSSPAAIPLLAEALRDQDETVRGLALDLLGDKGDDAVDSVKQALESPYLELREHARELLNRMAPEP